MHPPHTHTHLAPPETRAHATGVQAPPTDIQATPCKAMHNTPGTQAPPTDHRHPFKTIQGHTPTPAGFKHTPTRTRIPGVQAPPIRVHAARGRPHGPGHQVQGGIRGVRGDAVDAYPAGGPPAPLLGLRESRGWPERGWVVDWLVGGRQVQGGNLGGAGGVVRTHPAGGPHALFLGLGIEKAVSECVGGWVGWVSGGWWAHDLRCVWLNVCRGPGRA